jgi:uncharacterized membrane protein
MPKPEKPAQPKRKHFFIRGLAILLPSILTLWILWNAFLFVFSNVAEPINRGLRTLVIHAVPLIYTDRYQPEWYRVTPQDIAHFKATVQPPGAAQQLTDEEVLSQIRRRHLEQFWTARWHLQATGLMVAIVLIYLAGVLLGGFLGRRIYSRLERLISRIPGFKQVYPYVKQVVDLVLGDSAMAFTRVVMVEFPRPGSWVLGFVTGNSMPAMTDGIGRPCLTVFVPNTPTPFTGFTITVPTGDVIDVPISIDGAIRYLITGGVLVPEGQGQPPAPPKGPAALP